MGSLTPQRPPDGRKRDSAQVRRKATAGNRAKHAPGRLRQEQGHDDPGFSTTLTVRNPDNLWDFAAVTAGGGRGTAHSAKPHAVHQTNPLQTVSDCGAPSHLAAVPTSPTHHPTTYPAHARNPPREPQNTSPLLDANRQTKRRLPPLYSGCGDENSTHAPAGAYRGRAWASGARTHARARESTQVVCYQRLATILLRYLTSLARGGVDVAGRTGRLVVGVGHGREWG